MFVNAVYPPEPGATGILLSELAPALARRGWEVEVVTSGRPEADEPKADEPPGVRVRRVRPARRPRSVWRRGLSTGPLVLRLLAAAGRSGPADAVVLAADPPLLFLAQRWIRRRTGAAVLHWAHDLYPDVALALGVRVPAHRALAALARRALRRCDAVVAIGRDVARRIRAAGVAADRVTVIPNWATGPAQPGGRDSAVRQSLGLGDAFVVMYAGTLGRAHPFDAVLEAAAEWQQTDPDVVVVVVGGGVCRPDVEAAAQRRGLGNVRFVPPVASAALGDTLRAADLHLVTMDPHTEGMLVPSKTYGALAAGRPVLFLGPAGSEVALMLSEHSVGTVLDATDGAALAQCVRRWRDDADGRREAGDRAVRVASGGLERAADAFDGVLRQITSQP